MDNFQYPCERCQSAPNCMLETIKSRAVKSGHKKPNGIELTFTPVENLYAVKNPTDYEGLKAGDVCGLISELDGVAVVNMMDADKDYLVRLADLAQIYKVEELSKDIKESKVSKDFKQTTLTDRFKTVVVSLEAEGNKAEGIAMCNPSDKFDFVHGYKLALIRAQMGILAEQEVELCK